MNKFFRSFFVYGVMFFLTAAWWAYGYDITNDSDVDGIENNVDLCPGSIKWDITDAKGCTETQKKYISFPLKPDGTDNTTPDYLNADIDFDGISNIDEALGYTGATWTYLSGIYIKTSATNPDIDKDGLNDGAEKIKGTSPLMADTDADGISDQIDEELTSQENRRYVNATGKFDQAIFEKRDDDKDGIPDINEREWCKYSQIGAEVYKDQGEFYGCTQQQKIALLRINAAQEALSAVPTNGWNLPQNEELQLKLKQAEQQLQEAKDTSFINVSWWPTSSSQSRDLNINGDATNGKTRDGYIDSFKSKFGGFFFWGDLTGEKWAKYLLITIARDLKNVVTLLAIIYLFIMVFRLIFSNGSEEDIKKWRGWILWTSLGIIIMQISFVFISILFDKPVNGNTAFDFLDKIIYPFVRMLELLASFAFLAMAFYSFYLIISAGGADDKAKQGKQTILFAIAGFLLIKIPRTLVESIYGKAACEGGLFGICKISSPDLSATVQIMTQAINYFNGFIWIITVLLIIYAGFLVLTGAGDDEKMKKAKSIIKYAVIGIFLLVASYALFNFFVLKG